MNWFVAPADVSVLALLIYGKNEAGKPVSRATPRHVGRRCATKADPAGYRLKETPG